MGRRKQRGEQVHKMIFFYYFVVFPQKGRNFVKTTVYTNLNDMFGKSQPTKTIIVTDASPFHQHSNLLNGFCRIHCEFWLYRKFTRSEPGGMQQERRRVNGRDLKRKPPSLQSKERWDWNFSSTFACWLCLLSVLARCCLFANDIKFICMQIIYYTQCFSAWVMRSM